MWQRILLAVVNGLVGAAITWYGIAHSGAGAKSPWWLGASALGVVALVVLIGSKDWRAITSSILSGTGLVIIGIGLAGLGTKDAMFLIITLGMAAALWTVAILQWSGGVRRPAPRVEQPYGPQQSQGYGGGGFGQQQPPVRSD